MNKTNALSGLISNYGDSDDESDDGAPAASLLGDPPRHVNHVAANAAASVDPAIHPAPIPHCPWSACYDESSGYTYYWNQKTNAVTWEAPPEYLLALKLAQQHLKASGSEVSAEEWQLYQQALAEKQSVIKPTSKPVNKTDKITTKQDAYEKYAKSKKRSMSDDEEIKIEPITSFHNSDSESNDEPDSPVKKVKPKPQIKAPKSNPHKKQKTKVQVVEYGPTLPPAINYTVPIGPELPPDVVHEKVKSPENRNGGSVTTKVEDKKLVKSNENEDSQDENLLLKKLKDKAKLLEKLGGEIPSELQKIIEDETTSRTQSPKIADENSTDSKLDTNIDDLLEEIEKKELPKTKNKVNTLDMFVDDKSSKNSPNNSPNTTPHVEEVKALFPSSKAIVETKPIQENGITGKAATPPLPESVPKKENVYLMNTNETVEHTHRKKLRISNSVLPVKRNEVPSYTTKYSQHIEGFSSERTGLGFNKDTDDSESPKNTISYGKGLMFTKGETLNEDKKDDDLDDLADLVEAKLNYLNQVQPSSVTPVQEMLIQLQTLVSAFRAGSLAPSYWRRWVSAAELSLAQHEASAAPPGWTCDFLRSEGRYRYRREDGLLQYEYPATGHTDMDISTTPPHLGVEAKETTPPLPVGPPLPPPPPPAPLVATPPPPAWPDSPPPGCVDPPLPPMPPEPPKPHEISDELLSFYKDIAQLDQEPAPPTISSSPEPPAPVIFETDKTADKDNKSNKKKSKVKISSSIGMNQKTVSSLVAKWQQVAEEINSE